MAKLKSTCKISKTLSDAVSSKILKKVSHYYKDLKESGEKGVKDIKKHEKT